jgi:hypothetical protein
MEYATDNRLLTKLSLSFPSAGKRQKGAKVKNTFARCLILNLFIVISIPQKIQYWGSQVLSLTKVCPSN